MKQTRPAIVTLALLVFAIVASAAVGSRSSAVVVDPAPGEQSLPAIGFDGVHYLIVWEDSRSGSRSDIYGARVNQAGQVLDPGGIPISTTPYQHFSPAVAFDGENYLVVWDSGFGEPDIYGARVTRGGVVLDPAGINLSNHVEAQFDAAIAFDGANYLVTWQDSRSQMRNQVYGARVSPAGELLDPNGGFAISTEARIPGLRALSVAFDGTNSLVVWDDQRSGGYSDIYGARVSRSGTVLDPNGIPIATTPRPEIAPDLAFDGANYLVAWYSYDQGPPIDLRATRVSPAGKVLDPGGIPVSPDSGNELHPALAFDGANYLVVWEQYLGGGISDVFATRVTPGGGVLDPDGFAVSTALGRQWNPAVAFGTTSYLSVWADRRSGQEDILGTRISTAGAILDPDGILISTYGVPPAPAPPPGPPPPPPPPLPPPLPPPPLPVQPPPKMCRVPRVTGLRLPVARARIRRARCSVGRIRRRASNRRAGRVIAQNPRAGARRPRGARVNLVVGRRQR